MSRNPSMDSRRRISAGQRNIVTWCSCGREFAGNLAPASHRRANPDHRWLTYSQWIELRRQEWDQRRA